MSKIVPTLGRIVYFTLRAYDCDEINRRRKHASEHVDYHRYKKNGTQVHAGNSVTPGQVVPAMIVAVWGSLPHSSVNLKLMLDGSDAFWVTSVAVAPDDIDGKPTTQQGYYHWMPYQIGQAAKVDAVV